MWGVMQLDPSHTALQAFMFKETGCSTPGHLDHVYTVSDCARKSEGVGATPSVAFPGASRWVRC